MAPLYALRKLYRSLYQLRELRRLHRERLPVALRFKRRQDEIAERAEKEWSGGYIMLDNGDYVYVPAQLDITALERLTYKPAPEHIISKLCPAGGTVIDVGANMGDWTLPMAKAVGAEGRVFAFEPIGYLAETIEKTVKVNGISNTLVCRTALSDSEGEAPFTVVQGEGEMFNVRCSGIGVEHAGGKRITVPTTTLDAFVESEKLDRLDFIKVDVESHEAQVFKGAAETLNKFRPAVVFESGNEDETDEDRPVPSTALSPPPVTRSSES